MAECEPKNVKRFPSLNNAIRNDKEPVDASRMDCIENLNTKKENQKFRDQNI